MNDNESLNERDRWAKKNTRAIHSRNLPWEPPPWREGAEEPLSIPAVFHALMEIRNGKSRELNTESSRPVREQFRDPTCWVELNRPPENAVRIITRALQAGAKGEELIKKALELKPRAKGAILARSIARKLAEPKGGWPQNEENWERFNRDSVEWVKPSKADVERALEARYPEIYDVLPKKDSSGGKRLHPRFWEEAGLKEAIDQSRGY